jgi:peptidoglycan/xylan/chitin deacetylase (PgdA/CDA1 family)
MLAAVIFLQSLSTSATVPMSVEWEVVESNSSEGNFRVEMLELENINNDANGTENYKNGQEYYENGQEYLESAFGVYQTTNLLMNNIELHNGEPESGRVRDYLMERSGREDSLQELFHGELIEIDPNKPMVALTFDDGPSEYTLDILNTLSQHRSRGTFFVLGSLVEQHQDIIRLAQERGNEILGHSWSHVNLTHLSREQLIFDITRTHEAIIGVIGDIPRMYRPPYGSVNNTVIEVSEEIGFSIINWSLDTSDWMTRDADQIYDTIMEGIDHWSIILLHDTHASTAEAVKQVVPSLIERGDQLVTVSEMFYHLGEEVVPGMMVNWNWRQ